jgi:hypothetical protein
MLRRDSEWVCVRTGQEMVCNSVLLRSLLLGVKDKSESYVVYLALGKLIYKNFTYNNYSYR